MQNNSHSTLNCSHNGGQGDRVEENDTVNFDVIIHEGKKALKRMSRDGGL